MEDSIQDKILDKINDGKLDEAAVLLDTLRTLHPADYSRFNQYLDRAKRIQTRVKVKHTCIKVFNIYDILDKITTQEFDLFCNNYGESLWTIEEPKNIHYLEYDKNRSELEDLVDRINIELIRRGCVPNEVVILHMGRFKPVNNT